MHALPALADAVSKLPSDKFVWIIILAAFALAAFAIHTVALIARHKVGR